MILIRLFYFCFALSPPPSTLQLIINVPMVVIYTGILAAIQGWDLGRENFLIFASIAVLLQLGLVIREQIESRVSHSHVVQFPISHEETSEFN
jgi:hypothetical protein